MSRKQRQCLNATLRNDAGCLKAHAVLLSITALLHIDAKECTATFCFHF